MNDFFTKLKLIIRDSSLRSRLLFVLFALALFRVLANIPVPAASGARLDELLAGNQALGFLNVLTGGGLSAISIVMLGVGPYITASIIMQLLTMMSAKLKALYHEEGEAGRKKFTQYARLLTVPLAFAQGFGLLLFLKGQGVIGDLTLFEAVLNTFIIAAGSILLMWIGELISEFGIGNGVSLIIFAGIVAGLPAMAAQLLFAFDISQIPVYLGGLLAALLVVAGVVVVTEAERPIPITYAKRVRGMKVYGGISTYLPLRINQAGVIPIIFALSILIFPQVIFGFLAQSGSSLVAGAARAAGDLLGNAWVSSFIYFTLVFLFTYFYTAVTFDPDAIATNLQKSGAFIPGVRPGGSTSSYVSTILTRITFVGAMFLGFIAVLPLAMQSITGISTLAIGGTALLIVVSVVLDLVKKIDAQLAVREY